jgi:hypothetical protein
VKIRRSFDEIQLLRNLCERTDHRTRHAIDEAFIENNDNHTLGEEEEEKQRLRWDDMSSIHRWCRSYLG